MVLLALAAVFSLAAGAADLAAISGQVRDALGNVLADVEVLIVAPGRAIDPVAVVRSDSAGKFSISGLAPGFYRVAALKAGHRTFIGEVDTHLQSWVDVVLSPRPDEGKDDEPLVPRSSAWSLRLPRRSVLRETEASPAGRTEPPAKPDTVASSGAGAPLQLQVRQSYAVRQSLQGDEGYRPEGQGRETDLQVSSMVGERAYVQLRGRQESFDTARASLGLSEAASQDAASLSLGLLYDATADSQIDVTAYYDARGLTLSSVADPVAGPDLHRQRRSWGYDAAWTTQLDSASRLAVRLDYRDNMLEVPELLGSRGLDASSAGETSVSHRTVGAVGSYETLPANDHQVKVDLRARMVQTPMPLLRTGLGSMPGSAYDAMPGLSLGLDARDTWRVSRPFALVYGLGYKQGLSARGGALVVPRFGGTLNVEEGVLSFSVSYHHLAGSNEHADPLLGPVYRPARQLGYEASLELPITPGLRAIGAVRSNPIQLDPVGYASGGAVPDRLPVYLTDGNAAVDESRFGLIREGATVRAWVELTRGRVEGTLASVLPFAQPYQFLSEGEMTYATSRFGIRVASTGTDVVLDYRTIDEWGDGAELAAVARTSMGLLVTQDLMRLRSLGSWKLLVAVRTGSTGGQNASDPAADGWTSLLEATNREASAGLAVLF